MSKEQLKQKILAYAKNEKVVNKIISLFSPLTLNSISSTNIVNTKKSKAVLKRRVKNKKAHKQRIKNNA